MKCGGRSTAWDKGGGMLVQMWRGDVGSAGQHKATPDRTMAGHMPGKSKCHPFIISIERKQHPATCQARAKNCSFLSTSHPRALSPHNQSCLAAESSDQGSPKHIPGHSEAPVVLVSAYGHWSHTKLSGDSHLEEEGCHTQGQVST